MLERRIGIVGAGGFIGGELSRQARLSGWTVTGFSRSGGGPGENASDWRIWSASPDVTGLDALVNLAGHPIDRRWNERNRRLFHESRVGVTRALAGALAALAPSCRPGVVVNGSAVGIYGDRGDEILEDDATAGTGYLAELCAGWESAAEGIAALGVRTVVLRTGVALGRDGAAFRRMCLPFRFGLGGKLGSGRQWMPWIHVSDLAGAILHAVEHPTLSGPVNGSAPEPERNAEFTRKLARELQRPAWFTVPEPALKLALGDFASVALSSQRAVPRALLESGFRFHFPELSAALRDLV